MNLLNCFRAGEGKGEEEAARERDVGFVDARQCTFILLLYRPVIHENSLLSRTGTFFFFFGHIREKKLLQTWVPVFTLHHRSLLSSLQSAHEAFPLDSDVQLLNPIWNCSSPRPDLFLVLFYNKLTDSISLAERSYNALLYGHVNIDI